MLGGSAATIMIGIHARRLARLGVSKLTILVVDHSLIDPPGGHRAVGLRSVQTSSGVLKAQGCGFAEVLVLVDRGDSSTSQNCWLPSSKT
jgi:hypothetical protein